MPADFHDFIPGKELLSDGEIVRLARIFGEVGTRRIRLTGGEPLVREGIAQLAADIKRQPGIEKLALTTNGMLLEKYLDDLVKAGMDSVNISMDTLDEKQFETITRGGSLSVVMNAVDAALSYENLMVKINCVTKPGNEDMYVRLAALSRDSRICVRFIEMMPIGLGQEQSLMSSDVLLERLQKEYGEGGGVPHMYHEGPARYVHFPGFKGNVGFISAMSHQFCESCNRVRMTADGYLKTCLQYEAGVNLKELIRSGASDQRLIEEICAAIDRKPRAHQFTCGCKASGAESEIEKRGMSGIGG